VASDHDCQDSEGRLSVTLERLAEKLNTLPPDRQRAFGGWLEDEAMGAPSEALKTVIRQRGLTAYRLGKDSGASVDAIQRFLNGERSLKVETFDKLCATLGLALVEQKPGRQRRRLQGSNQHDRGPDAGSPRAGRSAPDRADASHAGTGDREHGDLLHG
jgi:transcriptional regulator with XRE-family HTH domain